MRRQVVLAATASLGVIVGIGLLVFIGQQGAFGGKAKQLYGGAKQAEKRGDLMKAQAQLEELVATFPDSQWADDGLFRLGHVYEAQQQLVEAQTMYQTLLERFPESPLAAPTQERLGEVNIALLFSPIAAESDLVHEVQPGDTLGRIAAVNGTTVNFLKRANGLDSDLIRPKQKLKIAKGRFGIVVDKSQHQLLLTREDRFVKAYPIATGKEGSTPVGTFEIVNKIPEPVWYRQGAIVPPESPENILGSRWLGFNLKGYGIHGSVDPEAIGHEVTAGCIRMTNADVEEIFDIVPTGTAVTIVD